MNDRSCSPPQINVPWFSACVDDLMSLSHIDVNCSLTGCDLWKRSSFWFDFCLGELLGHSLLPNIFFSRHATQIRFTVTRFTLPPTHSSTNPIRIKFYCRRQMSLVVWHFLRVRWWNRPISHPIFHEINKAKNKRLTMGWEVVKNRSGIGIYLRRSLLRRIPEEFGKE